jgi:hypothetical protein
VSTASSEAAESAETADYSISEDMLLGQAEGDTTAEPLPLIVAAEPSERDNNPTPQGDPDE